MSDDLKERLRANALDECDEAIDRIEQREAELDAAHKRGMEEAAKILDLHDSVPCEPNEAWSDEVKNAYAAAQIDAALSWQYAIRAKIQESAMSDAPKEIWVLRTAEGQAFVYDAAGDAPDDLRDDVKYIRADECKAREDAAYKRGLEEAAEIADKHLREAKKASSMARPDEVTTKVGCWAWGRAAEKIAAQIRHQIQED